MHSIMALLKIFGLLFCALLVQGEFHLKFPKNLLHKFNERIIDGHPAQEGQFPYQVHLVMDGTSKTLSCGGALISERHVITAAHCVVGMTRAHIEMGSTLISGGTIMQSQNITVHPQYNPTYLTNDIGIITLPYDIPNTNLIRPVRLPSRSQVGETHAGRIATVSGWGYTTQNGPESNTLNFVNLTVITNSVCAQYYGSWIVASTLCCQGSEKPSQGICTGDSGAPLVVRDTDGLNTLIGIGSFTSSTGCASSAPSGYARTNKFLDWIGQVTGIPIRS